MFSWLTGSSNLRSRLNKALMGTRLVYSRNSNGSNHQPTDALDMTLYLVLAVAVLLIFLCAAVMALFYFWQTSQSEREMAILRPTAFPQSPDIVEVIVIATPTVSATHSLPTAVPTLTLPPMTCVDIQRSDPSAADGEYTLYLNRNPDLPVNIYCHNMGGKPLAFVSLINVSDNANFATTAYPNDELITHFTKVRIDLHNLTLDPTDRTFAAVSGSMPLYSRVPYNDYGRAVGCNESQPGAAFGRANIDLTGTNFALDENVVTFALFGPGVAGSGAQISAGGQIVNLEAGGHCGWAAPVGPLQLKYVPSSP